MKRMQKIDLELWYISTQNLAKYFEKKYFGKELEDSYWIADEIGGVYCIADYFFDLSSITDYLKYRYTTDQMFNYYEYALELGMNDKTPVCIRDWKKLSTGSDLSGIT